MNTKIKNYVEVLFRDIPNTQKAQELKEELLSTLNDHFEAHIAEGKSENQAYTESLADLGDVDELLKGLEPDRELKEKIDVFRQKRAKNTAIAVMMYILGTVCVIFFSTIPDMLDVKRTEIFPIIGVISMLVFAAFATGLIIYTNMSMPQDVSHYISQKSGKYHEIKYTGDSKALKIIASFMKVYWTLVLVIYLAVSFTTGMWAWTWLIWVIASAVKEAIYIFFSNEEKQ
jgi:uncharacterized membrane protein